MRLASGFIVSSFFEFAAPERSAPLIASVRLRSGVGLVLAEAAHYGSPAQWGGVVC